jgi:meso-butanediol dehydrogenase/(S,S)-butanediol dehydrogenase/diacetyl reductase
MDDFDFVMNVNARGTLMMCQAALPHLLASKGFIVNMSSTAALGAHAWTIAYSASKGAVLSMTKCLAVEYMLQGLNCNAICPAGIDTAMVAGANLPEGADMRLLQKVMLPDGSMAPASDVAAAVAFLACEDANHINGEELRLDGGLMT